MQYMKNVTKEESTKAAYDIANILRGCELSNKMSVAFNLATYMLRRASMQGGTLAYTDFTTGKMEMSEILKTGISKVIEKDVWQKLSPLSKKYGSEVFDAVLLNSEFTEDLFGTGPEFATPAALCDLSIQLLRLSDGDSLMDLCNGWATLLLSVVRKDIKARYYGYEKSEELSAVAAARLGVSGVDGEEHNCDIFDLVTNPDSTAVLPKSGSRKIFANFPFGTRLPSDNKFLIEISKSCSAFGRSILSDWVYSEEGCRLMGDEGRCVCVLLNGSLSSVTAVPVRKYFLERGLIECVIALPPKLFEGTGVSYSLIVFSHGNKSVRFVNAERFCTLGRRRNTLSDADVAKINELVKNGGEGCCDVGIEKLSENDYVLNPAQYTDFQEEDGVLFGDIMVKSMRGAPCKAGDLDKMTSQEPTDIRYLKVANIKNGLVANDMIYLKGVWKDPVSRTTR